MGFSSRQGSIFSFRHSIYFDSETQPAYYLICQGKSGLIVKVTTHFLLVLKLRMYGVVPPPPQHA